MLMITFTTPAQVRGRGDAMLAGSACSIRGSQGGTAARLLG